MKDFLLTFYNDTFIIVIYTIILVFIAILKFRKNTENSNIFNCENLFIMFYYAFIALGPIYLVGIKKYTYNYNVFFIFLFGLICFIIGAELSSKIIDKKTRDKENNNLMPMANINYKSIITNSIILLAISYLCVSIYLIKNLSFILSDFENNRVLAMQGSGVIIHLAYMMLPTTWILYYSHLNYKNDKKIYIIFIIDIIFLLFIGFRSRIMELLLVAIIIKNDNKKFKIKRLFIYGIILLILVSVLQIIRTYVSYKKVELGIDSIAITMSVNSINLKYIFDFFPRVVPFQHGYTYLLSFSMLLPNSHMDSTLWLKQALNMSFSGGGVTPSILGEFFINFGYLGIFIGMFILGIVCKVTDNYVLKSKANKIIYYIIIFYLARSVSSGISNFTILSLWFIIVTLAVFKVKIKIN